MIYISMTAVGYIFIIMLSMYVVEYGSSEKNLWYVRFLSSVTIIIPIYIPAMIYYLYKGHVPSTFFLYRWFWGLSVTTSYIMCLYLTVYYLKPDENAFGYIGGLSTISIITLLGVFIFRFSKLTKP